jgi:hypothetical protein
LTLGPAKGNGTEKGRGRNTYVKFDAMADHDEELVPSKTEGFKVGEKKTIQQYQQLGM